MDTDFFQWLAILLLSLACIFNTMHCNYLGKLIKRFSDKSENPSETG